METPEQSRRTRRIGLPRRWPTRIALGLVVLGAFAVPVAWASHEFADVPNSNPHHNDISAIFGARITTGTSPGLYSPAQPVLREQMASFLRRGLGRTGSTGTTADITLTNTFQSIASATITAGGTTGGSGFVLTMGSATFQNPSGNMVENHRIEFRIRDAATGSTSNVSNTMLHAITDPLPSAVPSDAVMKQWPFVIPTGVTRTYHLEARVAFPSPPNTVVANSRLMTAMYFPFGPSGTSSPLGTAGEAVTPSSQPTPEQR